MRDSDGRLSRAYPARSLGGLVFVYFSEMLFWARPLESTTFPGVLGTILVYAFAAWLFLAVVSAFRVRSLAALFLAGAVFGWLIEGVFVQTLYGELPISVSLTGLSWHALITVLFGWYLLQWSLRFASAWRTLGIATLAGDDRWRVVADLVGRDGGAHSCHHLCRLRHRCDAGSSWPTG